MAFGLGTLRLSPDAFWRMTPREFAKAFAGLHGVVAPSPTRADLAALMSAWPDRSGWAQERTGPHE